MRKTTILALAIAGVILLIAFGKYLNMDVARITGFAVSDNQANSHAAMPTDRVTEGQIRMSDDGVLIRIANATLGRPEGTSSMEPLLDSTSSTIMIRPEKAEDIKEGDIIAYYSEEAVGLVVHRVVKVDKDENGWFAQTKGDNTAANDPAKVRFGQVMYVIIGILY